MVDMSSKMANFPFKVSYKSIYKGSIVAKDIAIFYFPLYEIPYIDSYKYCPLMAFVQAIIYEADRELEEGKYTDKPYTRNKNLIIDMLKGIGVFDEYIHKYLEQGEEYVRLEEEMMKKGNITYENIVKAAEVRSCDIRTLHAILFKMLERDYSQAFFDLVWPVEVMIDLEADILEYEKDIKEDNYNTYRMLVKLYGKEAKEKMEELHSKYDKIFKERLKKYSEDFQKKALKLWEDYHKYYPYSSVPEPIIEKN